MPVTIPRLSTLIASASLESDENTGACRFKTASKAILKRLLKVLREDIGIGEKNGNDGDSKVTNNIPPYLSFLCAKCLGPNNMKINRNKL